MPDHVLSTLGLLALIMIVGIGPAMLVWAGTDRLASSVSPRRANALYAATWAVTIAWVIAVPVFVAPAFLVPSEPARVTPPGSITVQCPAGTATVTVDVTSAQSRCLDAAGRVLATIS